VRRKSVLDEGDLVAVQVAVEFEEELHNGVVIVGAGLVSVEDVIRSPEPDGCISRPIASLHGMRSVSTGRQVPAVAQ